MADNDPNLTVSDTDKSRRSFMKLGALASGGLTLGTAGTGTALGEETAGEVTGEETSLNLADVTFLQLMAYHHRGAVEMAELAEDRTDRDELLTFAEDAINMQQEEVEQMKSILAEAGIEPGQVLDQDLDDVRTYVTAIPGEPEPNELTDLEMLNGEEFDLRFIELFTYHHSGAVQLSRQVLDEGRSPAVADLAEGIIDMQVGEITKMYEWYLDWV